MKRFVFPLLLLLPALTGCQTLGYYTQAISGQCQILHRQRAIASLLEDPVTPESLKQRLRFVLEVRAFAQQELDLPADGHYLQYANLGRGFAVWNVHAAPEFSLAPKSWWYPVVGRLDYRGYFSEQRARRYAASLEKQGYDVYVSGVAAYSTLGWFHDPVLNTFIEQNEMQLAELLFHELAHQRVFAAGDTDFNEAFATAVALEGLRRWTLSRNDPAASQRYQAQLARTEALLKLVARARARLTALYAESADLHGLPHQSGPSGPSSPAETRRAKQLILEQLRQDCQQLKTNWDQRQEDDPWSRQRLNNAQLNTVESYYSLVPAFRNLLQQHDGDLKRFYQAARALAKLKKEQRHLRLKPAPGG